MCPDVRDYLAPLLHRLRLQMNETFLGSFINLKGTAWLTSWRWWLASWQQLTGAQASIFFVYDQVPVLYYESV